MIAGPGQHRRQDGQGLALAVCFLEADQRLVARRMVAEEQDRRFREGPGEGRRADFRAGGTRPLARGFLGACDQAAGGHEILHPREASDVMHFLPEHEPEALANAWDGLEPIQGVGIMRLVRRDNGQRQIPEQRIIGPTQSKVDFAALLPGRIRNPLRNPVTGGLIGELRADLGQIVLTVGWLDMRQQLSPVAHQMHSPPEPVARGPHVGGIDVRLRQHAPRRSTAIFGTSIVSYLALPPWRAFIDHACPRTKGIPPRVHRAASQVPGEESIRHTRRLDTHDDVLPVGRDCLEKGVWPGRPMAVHQDLAIVVQEAQGPWCARRHPSLYVDYRQAASWGGIHAVAGGGRRGRDETSQLASRRNLQLAWRRITTGGNYQYKRLYRSLYYAYEVALDANLRDLRQRLLGDAFTPRHPERIYLPKVSGLHRPLALLNIEDQVVLQAFANLAAKRLQRRRAPLQFKVVFSNILEKHDSILFFRRWQNTYGAFQRRIRQHYHSGMRWVGDFDLAAFYDTISHELC